MADFHFVEDYERYVDQLIKSHPIDEAMSLAVGGSYDKIGGIEFEILQHFGLKANQTVLDLGCGSGRLAAAISKTMEVSYLGLDVVEALLAYARTKSPDHYQFVLNRALSLPIEDESFDVCCAFSVFTHLQHAETYLYLEEMFRGLRDGGKVVCSFLEFYMPTHWLVFESTLAEHRKGATGHLNQFVERNQFSTWARHIGFASVAFLDGTDAPWPSQQVLGQSLAVLTKGD